MIILALQPGGADILFFILLMEAGWHDKQVRLRMGTRWVRRTILILDAKLV